MRTRPRRVRLLEHELEEVASWAQRHGWAVADVHGPVWQTLQGTTVRYVDDGRLEARFLEVVGPDWPAILEDARDALPTLDYDDALELWDRGWAEGNEELLHAATRALATVAYPTPDMEVMTRLARALTHGPPETRAAAVVGAHATGYVELAPALEHVASNDSGADVRRRAAQAARDLRELASKSEPVTLDVDALLRKPPGTGSLDELREAATIVTMQLVNGPAETELQGVLAGLAHEIADRILARRGEGPASARYYGIAVDQYTRCLEALGDRLDLLTLRASALCACGRHDDALSDYSRALRIAPDERDTWRLRAGLHALMGRPALARRDLEQALALSTAGSAEHESLESMLAQLQT